MFHAAIYRNIAAVIGFVFFNCHDQGEISKTVIKQSFHSSKTPFTGCLLRLVSMLYDCYDTHPVARCSCRKALTGYLGGPRFESVYAAVFIFLPGKHVVGGFQRHPVKLCRPVFRHFKYIRVIMHKMPRSYGNASGAHHIFSIMRRPWIYIISQITVVQAGGVIQPGICDTPPFQQGSHLVNKFGFASRYLFRQ